MIVTTRLRLSTQGNGQIISLNEEVKRQVSNSGVTEGAITVFVTATTASIGIMELEPGLVQDLTSTLDRLVPQNVKYQHNILNDDTNGHSHTRASLIGPSLVVPVTGGQPILGVWQSIVLIDFDSRPREREVVLQVMGERGL